MKKILVVSILLVNVLSFSQEKKTATMTRAEVKVFFDSLHKRNERKFEKGVNTHFDSISKIYKEKIVSYGWSENGEGYVVFDISYIKNGKLTTKTLKKVKIIEGIKL
jgi:hypothetical protein